MAPVAPPWLRHCLFQADRCDILLRNTLQCLLKQRHWLMQPTISAERADLSNEWNMMFNFRSRFTQIPSFQPHHTSAIS